MAASRFTSLSEENITQLLNDKDSENTKKLTKYHRLIFESYLKEKNIRNPSTAVELAAVLRKFYAEARKKDGQMYSKNSLCSIRFALSNRIYEAQGVELKKQGLAKTEPKPPIADEDIRNLYRCGVFNTENPTSLQNKTDFEIKVNSQGKRCVVKTTDELTKNHRAHDVQAEDGPFCPVSSFEKYLS
ncbi:unnamed protein product, partial [Porites lobata]